MRITVTLNGATVYAGTDDDAAHAAWCEQARCLAQGDELVLLVDGVVRRAATPRAA